MAAVVRDSLWLAEDIVPGGTADVQQTWTQDVSAFGVDTNDPTWSWWGSQGFQTAWLKFVIPYKARLLLDSIGSGYTTILAVFSWDGTTAVEVASSDVRMNVALEPGTYLIGASQDSAVGAASITINATYGRRRPSMLLLGVGGSVDYRFTTRRQFDVGGIGTTWSERPFDLMSALTSTTSNRPFDIQGAVRVASSRPFDIEGGFRVTSPRPFDLVDATDGQTIDPGVTVPPGGPSNAVQRIVAYGNIVGGTFTLTFDGRTTEPLEHDASAATILTALEALSNIDPGDITVAGGPLGHNVTVTLSFAGQYAGVAVATVIVQTNFVSTLVDPSAGIDQTFVFSITAGGKTVVSEKRVVTATTERQLEVSVPNGGMVVVPVPVDTGSLVSFWIVSSRDVTMSVNDDGTPDLTVALTAGVPLYWYGTMYAGNPFPVDIASLKFVNAGVQNAAVSGAFLTED